MYDSEDAMHKAISDSVVEKTADYLAATMLLQSGYAMEVGERQLVERIISGAYAYLLSETKAIGPEAHEAASGLIFLLGSGVREHG